MIAWRETLPLRRVALPTIANCTSIEQLPTRIGLRLAAWLFGIRSCARTDA